MKDETILAVLGTASDDYHGAVNIPPYRVSTVIFPDFATFEASEKGTYPHSTYGRYGTPSSDALEETLAKLEGADHAIVTCTGLSAVVVALMAFLKSGDHLLMVDSVYGSTRKFCKDELSRFGIDVEFYDPLAGAGIASLIKPNTRVIFVESPGSQTFEVQDVPAIVKAAREKNKDIIVISDSTWGTPLFYKPFNLGVDVSVHSATKYISGHSDLMMGVITCKEKHKAALRRTFGNMAVSATGDNCYLALRGLRTMAVRLKAHQESALKIAGWLKNRPEVEAVLHPGLPGAPGHEIWKRDFSGSCGLFSIALKPVSDRQVAAMVDGMEYFHMGYSWGGFESLMNPLIALLKSRSVRPWPYKGMGLRLHIGLEHPDDLIADLEKSFTRLGKA